MAWAVALVGVAWVSAASFLVWRAGPVCGRFVDRWLAVKERLPAAIQGTGDAEPLPDDLAMHVARFQTQWARDSEDAAFREAKTRYGSWEKVRLAMNLTEGDA